MIKTYNQFINENSNIGTPIIIGGDDLSLDEKEDIINHAKSEIKRLGIKENIKINIIKSENKFAGFVVLKENPEKIKSITISTNSKISLKSLISHELTHVEQINNGRLFLKNGYIIYDDENVMTTKEYKKKFGGKWTKETVSEYENLAWEIPAYASE